MRNQRELYRKTKLREKPDNAFALMELISEVKGVVDDLAAIAKCTVTFDSDGGSEVDSQTVQYNTAATQPEDPEKEGYEFSGWVYGDPAVEYDFSLPVKSDITLTAAWVEETV